MRRTLLLALPILASLALATGCGDNNGPGPNPETEPGLNGQYIIQARVYDYYANGAVTSATATPRTFKGASAKTANTFHEMFNLKQPASHSAALSTAKPQSGTLNSAILTTQLLGSVTFDGMGNVTSGEIDFNSPLGGGSGNISVTGGYVLSTDGTGTIELDGNNFTVDLQVATRGGVTNTAASSAQFVEAEPLDLLGSFEIAVGALHMQDASDFTQGSINGGYAFGWTGETCYNCNVAQNQYGDISAAGVLNFNGSGNITGTTDIATGFATDNNVALTGSYTAPDRAGRATASLSATGYSNGALPQSYVVYVGDSSHLYTLAVDQPAGSEYSAAYVAGNAVQQSGAFSGSTLSGNYVFYETKEDLANEQSGNADAYSDATVGLLGVSGDNLAGTADTNYAGNVTSNVAFNYGYSVGPAGRLVLTGNQPSTNAPPPVCWLASSALGFCTEQPDSNMTTEPGLVYLQQQSGSSFSNSTFSGQYSIGTLLPATSLASLVVGAGSANGSSGTSGGGTLITQASYANYPGAYTGDASGSYSISSNGRGTFTSNSSSVLNNGVLYVVSSSEILQLDTTSKDYFPAIQIWEK